MTLTMQTFSDKVMYQGFDTLSRFIIALFPRTSCAKIVFVFLCLIYFTFSPSIIPSKSIHVVVDGKFSFFFLRGGPGIYAASIQFIYFIHLSVDRHLGCFHILGTVNNASLNIRVHVFFQINVFIFLIYIQDWNYWIMW